VDRAGKKHITFSRSHEMENRRKPLTKEQALS
jgi:hypothetical protein